MKIELGIFTYFTGDWYTIIIDVGLRINLIRAHSIICDNISDLKTLFHTH